MICTLLPWHQAQLPVGDDAFADRQTLLHDHLSCCCASLVVIVRASTVLSSLITKTKVPCCPFWTACEGITSAFGLRFEREIGVHELPRPEPPVAIHKDALQLDRSGRRIHLIVNKAELATHRTTRVIPCHARDHRFDRQIAAARVLLHFRQILLRAR